MAVITVYFVWKLYCEFMQAPGMKLGSFPSWSVISEISGVTMRMRPGMNYVVY